MATKRRAEGSVNNEIRVMWPQAKECIPIAADVGKGKELILSQSLAGGMAPCHLDFDPAILISNIWPPEP